MAPVNNHRPRGIVERLIQNIEHQLRCFKLDEDESYLNGKELIHQIVGQLQNCKLKMIQISPFEAHHCKKPNTYLSNLICSPSHKNLLGQNVRKTLFRSENYWKKDLISDEAWYEAIRRDNEVQKKKEEIVEKTKAREEVEED